MDWYQALILGIIQGITEFLPISSSAHLILLPKLTDLPDQGLLFDVVVHMGTLLGVILYYQKTIANILYHFFTKNPNTNHYAKLGWGVLLGTIPVGVAGFLFKDMIETDFRSTEVIAYATIGFGLFLYLASYFHSRARYHSEYISLLQMIFIGMFQALALIPGTSRSGITITAGLLLGLHLKTLTQFAFLLSIPVIILSLGLLSFESLSTDLSTDWLILVVGFGASFFSALLVLALFIKLIETIGMLPFVVYRVILGLVLLFTL